MEQNKITTWWGKGLLILCTYGFWFLFINIINFSYFRYVKEEWLNTIFILFVWFVIYLLIPLLSIYLTKKIIINKSNIKKLNGYFLNIIAIILYFCIFLK